MLFNSTRDLRNVIDLFFFAKNIGKNLNGEYKQKILDHTKQSTAELLKLNLKRVIQKTAKKTGELISYKVADKIIKISTTPLHNTSETVKNETEYIELDRDMPRERYISSEKRKKIIDKLRLI